jgi:hypothetical protein
MSTHIIPWSKNYYEDLGEKDEEGFFDYAYRYFIYEFYLPNNYQISVRQYCDTIHQGHLFLSANNFLFAESIAQQNDNFLKKAAYISAIIDFMSATQAISEFDYFVDTYRSIAIDLNEVSDFSFIEMTQ